MKKTILVTRNQLLSQEINSDNKKSILVKRNPFLWTHILRLNYSINSQQHVHPTKKFAWAYKFLGNLVPRLPVNLLPCTTHYPLNTTHYTLHTTHHTLQTTYYKLHTTCSSERTTVIWSSLEFAVSKTAYLVYSQFKPYFGCFLSPGWTD